MGFKSGYGVRGLRAWPIWCSGSDKYFEAALRSVEGLHLEPVGASGAGQVEEEPLHRIHVDRCWPRVPVQGVGAFFRAVKEGLPKYQVAAQALRQTAPRHCCRER